MPQYALIGSHPPNVCPMTSKAAREAAIKAYAEVEKSAKKKGARLVTDIHLDPDHKTFQLWEAPSAETVRDIMLQAGFFYFLNIELYLVTPVPDLLKEVDKFPTIYP